MKGDFDMGLIGTLAGAFGTVTIAKRYVSKASEWLENSETGRMVKEKIQDVVDGFVADYTANLEPERWNDMVSTDMADVSETDAASYTELSGAFSDIISKTDVENKWKNIQESIGAKPAEWGKYLADRDITAESLKGVEQRIADGENVSAYDVIKMATSAEKSTEASDEADKESQRNSAVDDMLREAGLDGASEDQSQDSDEVSI